MNQERWVDLPFAHGLYSISDHGNVKRNTTGRILKPYLRKGYPTLKLSVNGDIQRVPIHRWVALMFVDNPRITDLDCNIVNHIDEDKTNCHWLNLEWCTISENTQHSSHKWTGDKHYKKRQQCSTVSSSSKSIMD